MSGQSNVDEGVVYEKDGVKITAFEVDHKPTKPAFGYRIDYGGRSVVLSGDTGFSENLIQYAQGVDLLVHSSPETTELTRDLKTCDLQIHCFTISPLCCRNR